MKNRTIASKIPPRFAKKQGNMGMEQHEETISSNNLGTEIWETNSSGSVIKQFSVCFALGTFVCTTKQEQPFSFACIIKSLKEVMSPCIISSGIHLFYSFIFLALSVQSSGGDSWTKQVSYTGSEPNSEVA